MKAFLDKYHHQATGTFNLLCAAANLFVVWLLWPDPFSLFSAFLAGTMLTLSILEFVHARWWARVRREIAQEYEQHRKEFSVYAKKTIREVVHEVADIHGLKVNDYDDGPPITRH